MSLEKMKYPSTTSTNLTASGILSEQQQMIVLNTIQKVLEDDANVYVDANLYDRALPYIILRLVAKHYNLPFADALKKIREYIEERTRKEREQLANVTKYY